MRAARASRLLLAGAASASAAIARRRRRRPARAVIVSPRRSTVVQRDGAVRSLQRAQITLPRRDLEALWTPANLENLARTYWAFLGRATLGLIRVVYDEDSRSVVLLGRPLTLLRFDKPRYTMTRDRGTVTWQIRDGRLVAKAGRGSGYLALDVRRSAPAGAGDSQVHIEVEVANFYPSIAVGFSVPVYEMTQAAIHVLVTHAFLRSLATLHLAESKVGELSGQPAQPLRPVSPRS